MICTACMRHLGFARPGHRPTTIRCAICLRFSRDGYDLDDLLKGKATREIVEGIKSRLWNIKKKQARLEPHVQRHYRYINETISLKGLWEVIDKKTTTVKPVRYKVEHDYSSVKDKTNKRKAEHLISTMSDAQKQALLAILQGKTDA